MTRQTPTTSRRHSRRLQGCGLALGLVLLAGACSKSQLIAPTGSTLTLMVSRTTAGLGTTVDVTALVMEASGTPVHDGTVVAFFATLGAFSASQATTTNGQATVQLLTGSQSGVADITATSGAAKLAATVKITLGAAAVGRVELAATPTSLPSVGGTAQLTATVSDSAGGGTTDASGQVQSRLTTFVRTVATASVAGGTSGSVTSPAVIITVRTPPNAAIGTVIASGLEVTILYTAFGGSDGAAIKSVSINFGDGTSLSSLAPGSNQSVVHVYRTAGTFVPVLTVTDVAGETASSSASVVVTK
jgi:hypothetical protein